MKHKIFRILALLMVLMMLFCSCRTTSQNGNDTESTDSGHSGALTQEPGVTDTAPLPVTQSLTIQGATVRDGGDGCQVQVIAGVEKTAYDAYLLVLESNSYTRYTDAKIGFNYSATYTDSNHVVNVVYSSYNKTLRVMTEPIGNTSLPAKEVENTVARCQPLAISVGLAADNASTHKNGMCYIFRLEDGSFVIYDGGWDHQSNRMSEKIYKVLCKNAPEGETPVISAWVITHAHTDHIGGFNNFIRSYRDQVTVKNILVNTPSGEFCTQTSMSSKVEYFKNTLKMCKSSNIIKAHPMQKLVLPGATLEVLYTLDLYDADTLDEYNTASVVTRLTIGEQSFLMTGDMSETSNQTLCEMYGSKLSADFVQVSHHGYIGGTVAFYNLVKADYVLWPASKIGYDEMKNKARNANFKSLSAKKLIVALDNISILTLPYAGQGATVVSCGDYLNGT